MLAVWSYWSKPFDENVNGVWLAPKYHFLSWVLSVQTATRHYPDTVLYTDSRGADLLVGKLGLRFGEVSTELDGVRGDREWWSLGKLYAYRRQQAPFVHIDADVYLWKPLPDWLTDAPVFAQNPEFIHADSWYEPVWVERALAGRPGTWLPEPWTWYRSTPLPQYAPCCGILGGTAPAFLSSYAAQGIEMLECEDNRIALENLGNRRGHMILIEQYFLAACLEYQRLRSNHLSISYLFPYVEAAYDQENAAQKGYTHLSGGAKGDPQICERIELRVRSEYPEFHDRVSRLGL